MKSLIAATLAVVAGLLIASMLGVAAAEAPTSTPPRTVTVRGVATVPVAQGASVATATAAYRQAMAAAILDGQDKAGFLAGKVGSTLGSVQSIAEGGGSISCTGGGEESSYAEYQGEQPDFGSGESVSPIRADSVSAPRAASKPKKKKKHKTPAAKKATTTGSTCTLSTQVLLVYDIN